MPSPDFARRALNVLIVIAVIVAAFYVLAFVAFIAGGNA